MKPFYDNDGVTLYHGSAERLPLADGTVQTCVTSPPYWGLRDYGIDGQIGLEPTPEQYVARLVGVFREVRRVLRDDGTLWLNLGDSYSGGGRGNYDTKSENKGNGASRGLGRPSPDGIKPKDLVGIPWRVAFALQADGWYLRSDIIWHKPNPMPESVTDRPTKAHEYLFLLAKSADYFYDADAIRETAATAVPDDPSFRANGKSSARVKGIAFMPVSGGHTGIDFRESKDGRRNKRSVWTVTPNNYPGAHFATFPPELITPCILAGSRPSGKRCDCDVVIATPTGTGSVDDPSMRTGRAGMNRPRRPDEGTRPITRREQRAYAEQLRLSLHRDEMAVEASTAFSHYIRTDASGARPIPPELLKRWTDRGWLTLPPPCTCPTEPADIVLDCFNGSGTTGAVARQYGRRYVGVELNAEYLGMTRERFRQGYIFPIGGEAVSA